MPAPPAKIFVLDTNVILHDSACIRRFDEHDVVVPIAVLEELDHFKKGNESIHFHAREFVRDLDTMSGDKLFNGGARIGDRQGRMTIKLDRPFHPDLELSFPGKTADHRILNAAYHLHRDHPEHEVILVTKDVNLRMKAKSIGLRSQDYRNDHVADVSRMYTGHRLVEGADPDLIEAMYGKEQAVPAAAFTPDVPLLPNEFLILRTHKKSVLATYDAEEALLRRVPKGEAYGVESRNAGQAFALAALLDPRIQLVTLAGKAGTGKTLLSLAAAVEQRREFLQVFITRPVVPLSNKDIGYLPGDIKAKLIPYMQPLYDNLSLIQNSFPPTDKRHRRITAMLEEEKLKIEPLSYIRGRSLSRIFFLVDEAQNLTPHEIKTIITRAGEGTKVVFSGDIFQIDHPYLDAHSNGLSFLIEKMKGQSIYAHVNLEKGERSELAELASNLL